MIHVTLPQLCAYLDDELPEASAELVRRHLSECMECTERFGGLEEQEGILARILSDEPDEEFFERLGASIPLGEAPRTERPARTEKPATTRERVKVAPTRMRRRAEDQHRETVSRRAAWIVAAIVLVVAGSLAWVVLRPRLAVTVDATTTPQPPSPEPEAPTPPEAEQSPMESPEQEAEPTPEPTIEPPPERAPGTSQIPEPGTPPAPKSKPKPAAAPPPTPERIADRAPRHLVPVRTIITETIVGSGAEDAALSAIPEAPRSITTPDRATIALGEAKSASLEAAKSKLPAAFDKSADAWEAALPLLDTSPETIAMARRELAQSRFQAWAADPTPARREAAIASTRQYLLYAPPGPERDQAWTWLGRLKH